MVSTYLSYKMYTSDLSKSVARTLSDPQVSREQTYYRDNIGKVTSVDDFLKDQRLYSYAMKAYGLEDMTYAKAFMRKVLESDLTDDKSFVRKLVDQRYITFARAFNFTTTGDVASGTTIAQDASDEEDTVGLYSEQRVRKGAAVAAEVEYYQARIGSITTADQLVSDSRLFSFALKSFGIDPSTASEATIKKVLTSDLSDPDSMANKLNDSRYRELAAGFSFESDGSVPAGQTAQTAAQRRDTILLHYEATGNGTSPAAAAFKSQAYAELMAGVTSVDDVVNDDFLKTYAATAAGLDPILLSPLTLREVLTSDLSDPDSLANSLDSYRTLAEAFNFNTDGTLDDGVPAQTAAQLDNFADGYIENYDNKVVSTEEQETSYYKLAMSEVKSVDDLLANAKLYNYALKAFDLDPTQESASKIKQVLKSDLSNRDSFANKLGDSRYTALAAAFNFGTDGEAQGAIRAQITHSKSETITRYTVTLGKEEADQARGKTESEYYNQQIDTITSVDELLEDTRVVAYIKKAFGFEKESISDQTLRQILTSDPFDSKSFVNKGANTKYRDMAAAFNFGADGKAQRIALGEAQDKDERIRTQDMYIRQTMEEQAGSQNEGVRLALYFQRKASSIVSPYSILADKALLQVVLTALALPDSIAQAEVDTQAKAISKRLDVADFKDPAKVEKFLARFTALYDVNNQQTSSSPASILLGQQQGGVISDALLSSIQATKLRF